ncbi:MAG: amidohydrolase family protein [Candidatus Acidiferrales bacterium]
MACKNHLLARVVDSLNERHARACGPLRREFLSSVAACGMGAILLHPALRAGPLTVAGKPRLIDFHHHIFPPAFLAVALGNFQKSLALSDWTPQRSLDEMDSNGVATSIVSLTSPGVWFGNPDAARTLSRKCNDYAAQLVRDYPDRFGFFAAVPLPDTEGSLREIAYALDVLKADGIGLLTSYGDKWPGDPAYAAVFDELNRRKALVYFHPTVPNCCKNLIPSIAPPLIEYPHDTTRAVVSLLFSGSFARLRDIRFIFSHAGGTIPMLAGRIAQLEHPADLNKTAPNGVEYELKRLHYEIANSANRSSISALTNLVPISQILFGSDFPFVPTRVTAVGMTHVGLSAAELRAIGRENAIALLPRLKAQVRSAMPETSESERKTVNRQDETSKLFPAE